MICAYAFTFTDYLLYSIFLSFNPKNHCYVPWSKPPIRDIWLKMLANGILKLHLYTLLTTHPSGVSLVALLHLLVPHKCWVLWVQKVCFPSKSVTGFLQWKSFWRSRSDYLYKRLHFKHVYSLQEAEIRRQKNLGKEKTAKGGVRSRCRCKSIDFHRRHRNAMASDVHELLH